MKALTPMQAGGEKEVPDEEQWLLTRPANDYPMQYPPVVEGISLFPPC